MKVPKLIFSEIIEIKVNRRLILYNVVEENMADLTEIEDKMIHKLATSIRKRFEKLPPTSPKCCIYKIPRTLGEVNRLAYTPCLISIGPFHHGKKKLQSMQENKLRYLQNFLKRNKKKKLLDYLTQIKQWEEEVRESYVEQIELNSKEFNEMVLLDGCFLIEFFLVWFLGEAGEIDCIFKKPSLELVVMRDILLLENQLPFFVLEGLYNIAFGGDEERVSPQIENPGSASDDEKDGVKPLPSFLNLCCEVLFITGKIEVLEKFRGRQILHLVDFLRLCYLPSILRDPNERTVHNSLEFPPRVERLHDAGIKFEVAKKDVPLLDIEFSNGVLKIPKLEVEDHTESLLLNLSAFEQCHYHLESYIVDYVVLMDVLITTLKDVDILTSGGIILNSLGTTEEFADVFNTICKGTTYQVKGFYYTHLCKELNAYYKTPWHRWRATLNHDYFSNPWTIISVIVAVVLLILTVIQTTCTIISMKY